MNAAVPEPSLSALVWLLLEQTLQAVGIPHPLKAPVLIPVMTEGRPRPEGVPT